ncbi:hypothetical protein EPO56_03030 [Patescibacteria group bacterium]|nr:MAG: hypothetical protein EPO56_03030 [Patescibacteria group bacterium]
MQNILIYSSIALMKEKPKIAIVAPGGGTGCAYGAGAFTALAKEYQLRPDIIVASSGDAGTGVYYTSGQIEESEKIWTKALATTRFIAKRRGLKLMKLDYLVDTVFRMMHPFDVDSFYSSEIDCYIPITDRKTKGTRYISNRDVKTDSIDMFEVLRATKSIPVLTQPVTIEGREYEDGSFGATFDDLIQKAKDLGAEIIIGIDSRWRKRPILSQSDERIDICIVTDRKNPSSPLTSNPQKLRDSFDMGYKSVLDNPKLKAVLTVKSE